jgi:hypothetical protein
MPIPLPNLDDWTYADLTAEAQAMIPTLAPAWTDHNPSDPGITLVELLAWLTEMLMYQVDQVPAANTEKFLKLLNGPDWSRPPGLSLDDAIRLTMLGLRERYRAVTAADYEWLALHAWPQSTQAGPLGDGATLARVQCVPRRNLAAGPDTRQAEAPAHLSLVVVPAPGPAPVPPPAPDSTAPDSQAPDSAAAPDPYQPLYDALWQFFDERRLLTTRHHVVGPGYVTVAISANLALHDDASPFQVLAAARQALAAFYDPLAGGPGNDGWPFGRAVYASEASAVLERVPLVDYVEDVQVTAPDAAGRVQADGSGRPVAVELDAHELVQLGATPLVAYDVRGQHYQEP